ncbi:cytochrome P450 6g1-like [Cochliomyia hominivorax]
MIASSVFILISCILILVYYWCKYTFSYWQRKGIPYIKPTPIIGNTKEAFLLKTHFGLHISDIYNDPKMSSEPVVGIYVFNQPALIIREPELLKSILIKDFNYFNNRFSRCDPHGDALGNNNLFFARDSYWKELRTKITPVFTSGKIKQMYPLMLEVSSQLEQYLAQKGNNFEAEVKEICALFTTDLIATIAYGINANSLKNPEGEFRRVCRKIFLFDLKRSLEFSIAFFLPKLVTPLRVKIFTAEFSKFLRSTINYVMQERERTGKPRNDLIDILVALKRESSTEGGGKINEAIAKNPDVLIAQAAVFLTAGFETSSTTMQFTLYELAKRPDLQNRLRKEINEALIKDHGNLSYETITSLEYLGMVVDEVLRLYPVLPFLDRQHNKPTGEKSGFSLKPYHNYTLPNDMPVYLPIFGIQRDPKYWPNPNTFDPERFSPENKKLQHSMTYMPFGTGPHNCIGTRIGLLQTKLGLVHIFKNHKVELCAETPTESTFDPKALFLQFENGMPLKVIRDNLYDSNS